MNVYVDITANLKNVDNDIDKAILKTINIDIDKEILETIDIDKEILENIDIDEISNRLEFGMSNRAIGRSNVHVHHRRADPAAEARRPVLLRARSQPKNTIFVASASGVAEGIFVREPRQ